MEPLDIINGPLMDGMREVGRLFNANELIVAEVLQSAEAMKAAVSHLEKFMEKKTGSRKGKVMLATVKGDVHDIGKNLVEIILSNNGYDVVNLGIKVPPEKLIEAAHGAPARPDRPVGPARQERAADGHHRAGPDEGGRRDADARRRRRAVAEVHATTASRRRTRASSPTRRTRCAASRSPTASSRASRRAREIAAEADKRRAATAAAAAAAEEIPLAAPAVRSESVEVAAPVPAPDGAEHVLGELDLAEVWPYLNPHMLYAKHLGLRGSYRKLKEANDPKLAELERVIEKVQSQGWITRARDVPLLPGVLGGQHAARRGAAAAGEACFRSRARSRASGSRSPTSSTRRTAPARVGRRDSRRASSSRPPARACARAPRS